MFLLCVEVWKIYDFIFNKWDECSERRYRIIIFFMIVDR